MKARALRQAACDGQVQALKRLCKTEGVDVNAVGPDTLRTALHWSAYNGHNNAVSYLLKAAKAKSDLLDIDGNTPLNLAVLSPHISLQEKVRVIETLLARGAKPADSKVQNVAGKTPLMNLISLRAELKSTYYQLKMVDNLIRKIKATLSEEARRLDKPIRIQPNGQVVAGEEIALLSDVRAYGPLGRRYLPPVETVMNASFRFRS